MKLFFPFETDRTFSPLGGDQRMPSYRANQVTFCDIKAPTSGYVIMFRYRESSGDDHWRLLFFPRNNSMLPSHPDWVMPNVKGFYLSIDNLEIDSQAANKVVYKIFKQYFKEEGRYVIPKIRLTSSGNYRESLPNFQIIPDSIMTDASSHEIDPLLTTSANEFVTTYWGRHSRFVLEVSKGFSLYTAGDQSSSGTFNVLAKIGLFYAQNNELPNFMEQNFYWFDFHEYFQRLRDASLLIDQNNSPFQVARNDQQADLAIHEPFSIYCTQQFDDVNIVNRLNLFGGLQNIQLSLPYTERAPRVYSNFEIPEAILYIVPEFLEPGSTSNNEVLSGAFTSPGEEAIWRLQKEDSSIVELSGGDLNGDLSLLWANIGSPTDEGSWISQPISVLLNFERVSSSSAITPDVKIDLRYMIDISSKIRSIVNRIYRIKANLARILEETTSDGTGYKLSELFQLYNLISTLHAQERIPPELKLSLALMLQSRRATEIKSRVSESIGFLERNISGLGLSLKLNVFERPYFANQLNVNPSLISLHAEVILAMDGTAAGRELINSYAEDFIRSASDTSYSANPNHYINIHLILSTWKKGRRFHKFISYFMAKYTEAYIISNLVNSNSLGARILELENEMRRFGNTFGLELSKVNANRANIQMDDFRNERGSVEINHNYRFRYKNDLSSSELARRLEHSPSDITYLSQAMGIIDLIAKYDSMVHDHNNGFFRLIEFSASLGKYMVGTVESLLHLNFRIFENNSSWRVLTLRGVAGASGTRVISATRFLGAISAGAALLRTYNEFLTSRSTEDPYDDWVTGVSMIGYGAIFLGESGSLFSLTSAGVSTGLLGLGTVFILFSYVLYATVPSVEFDPDEVESLDVFLSLSLRNHYFGRGREPFMRDDVYENRYMFQLDAHTVQRQISNIYSYFIPFEVTGSKIGDKIHISITSEFLYPESRIGLGLYPERMMSLTRLSRIKSYAIKLPHRSTPLGLLDIQISTSPPSSGNPNGITTNVLIVLSNEDLPDPSPPPHTVNELTNRIEVILSIGPGIDNLDNQSPEYFADYYPNTVRKVIVVTP